MDCMPLHGRKEKRGTMCRKRTGRREKQDFVTGTLFDSGGRTRSHRLWKKRERDGKGVDVLVSGKRGG